MVTMRRMIRFTTGNTKQSLPIEPEATNNEGSENCNAATWQRDEEHEYHPAPTLDISEHLVDLLHLELFSLKPLLIGSYSLRRISSIFLLVVIS